MVETRTAGLEALAGEDWHLIKVSGVPPPAEASSPSVRITGLDFLNLLY
jgi:hypothetical protein